MHDIRASSGDCGEGLSFRIPWDEWRRARALSLVTNTRLPLSEVSEALGYSEQGVYTEAFRCWYGGTPHRVRMQRLAEALEGESAAGHLGKEVLHLFEPGYRRHPELH